MVITGALLCAGIVAFPVVEAIVTRDAHAGRITLFSVATLVVLIVGAIVLTRRGELTTRPADRTRLLPLVVIAATAVPWAMVIVDSPHAAYFLIALVVIAQWLLPPVAGISVTLCLTAFASAGQVVHHGWTAGAVIGPIAAAGLVSLLMSGYRTVLADSTEKSRLVDELRAAHEQLAVTEREAGRLAERARLGRDLHDTVAQSLSSIQLLLHAAERADDHETGIHHVRRARQTAAESLAETRAFISNLAPPQLARTTLATALARVAERAGERGLTVHVSTLGTPRRVPMEAEATLLRVTQEAVANVVAHAHATSCEVRLAYRDDGVAIEIDDDGDGFDAESVLEQAGAASGSYGLAGMRERTAYLGGYTVVVSEPGEGALVSAFVPIDVEGEGS